MNWYGEERKNAKERIVGPVSGLLVTQNTYNSSIEEKREGRRDLFGEGSSIGQ